MNPYCDDEIWTARYLVVEAGNGWIGLEVLPPSIKRVSPSATGSSVAGRANGRVHSPICPGT
jgi:hypothetical protein